MCKINFFIILIIFKYFNLEIINKAKGGESNEYIQFSIQKSWNDIELDDLVIISTTAPTRTPIFIKRDDNIILGSMIPEIKHDNLWNLFKKDWFKNI